MVLTPAQARKFYDRFGSKQDTQAFYEDVALDTLIAHADLAKANAVFEFGCGTGRFAVKLLSEYLPESASYLGMDVSTTMTELATQRLSQYNGRASVIQSDGKIAFPLADQSVDRVISTYVLDLLSEKDISQFIGEAHRVLRPGGKLCLVSLTRGCTMASRAITGIWSLLFRLSASMVGGCRPIQLVSFIDRHRWSIEYHDLLTQFGVPSEILIVTPNCDPGNVSRTRQEQ
ncbi:MAG: class I SAM-dependent methyltransferase [Gammaproteobacteria bacterium]